MKRQIRFVREFHEDTWGDWIPEGRLVDGRPYTTKGEDWYALADENTAVHIRDQYSTAPATLPVQKRAFDWIKKLLRIKESSV